MGNATSNQRNETPSDKRPVSVGVREEPDGRIDEEDAACDPDRLGDRDQDALNDLESLIRRRLQHIRLTQDFAVIANSSDSVDDGLSRAMERFCAGLDWPVGHAYLQAGRSSHQYVDSGLWWVRDGVDVESFKEVSATAVYEPGDGFVGEIVSNAEARWVRGRLRDALRERAVAAEQAGLKCAIGFPILVQSRVAGVLEFFADDDRLCERELLDAVAQIGTELGRVVERSEFERNLARIQQDERQRLGRELHDTLSQHLTGIGMLARSLERKLEAEGHEEIERSKQLVSTIGEAREQLRAIARGLNPVDVNAGSLSDVVEGFVSDTSSAFGISCCLEQEAPLRVEDDFTANQLYLIIREAVYNAAKHAHADMIVVRVRRSGAGELEVTVRDNGQGFDPEASGQVGMGLRTLRYRARLLEAKLRIGSAPGEGAVVACVLKQGGARG